MNDKLEKAFLYAYLYQFRIDELFCFLQYRPGEQEYIYFWHKGYFIALHKFCLSEKARHFIFNPGSSQKMPCWKEDFLEFREFLKNLTPQRKTVSKEEILKDFHSILVVW